MMHSLEVSQAYIKSSNTWGNSSFIYWKAGDFQLSKPIFP